MEIKSCDCFKRRAVFSFFERCECKVRYTPMSDTLFDVSMFRNKRFGRVEVLEVFLEIEFCPFCGKGIKV